MLATFQGSISHVRLETVVLGDADTDYFHRDESSLRSAGRTSPRLHCFTGQRGVQHSPARAWFRPGSTPTGKLTGL